MSSYAYHRSGLSDFTAPYYDPVRNGASDVAFIRNAKPSTVAASSSAEQKNVFSKTRDFIRKSNYLSQRHTVAACQSIWRRLFGFLFRQEQVYDRYGFSAADLERMNFEELKELLSLAVLEKDQVLLKRVTSELENRTR